jgi:Spy/CpxP family protein refolding chaperone
MFNRVEDEGMKVSRMHLSFALTAVMMWCGAAVAQSGEMGGPGMGGRHGGARMDPQQQLQRLDSQLKLTSDQKAKIQPILEDQDNQMKQLWQDQSASRQDKMSKMREIHESASGKIRDVLTDQQRTKYDAMEKEREQQMRNRMQGGPGAGPGSGAGAGPGME